MHSRLIKNLPDLHLKVRRLAGSKRGAESRRRINYQLGILTDSLGKRTVNRQLGRQKEKERIGLEEEEHCIGVC